MSEWMDVDIALASVPVNMLPLIDDTDFKSIEAAVVFNQSGLALFWNFTTTAGVTTVTAVTPTSAGDYDWTDFTTSGMYGIEIPASGGASANNDTEGFGYFTGVATGILPWRGPTMGFRAAGLNNALIDSAYSTTRGLTGTAVPDATADGAGGIPISDAGGVDMDALAADAARLTAARAAVLTDLINGGRLDLLIDAILLDTGTTLDGKLDTIDNFLDTEIAAITAAVITNAAGADVAADIIAMKAETVLIVADTNELQGDDVPGLIAALNDYDPTGQMSESYAANSVAPTRDQALMAVHQMLMQFGISGTSLTVRKLDNSTTAFIVTLDDDTSPTDAKRV